jgi:hypothetical protein
MDHQAARRLPSPQLRESTAWRTAVEPYQSLEWEIGIDAGLLLHLP